MGELNLSNQKTPIKNQEPLVRKNNFDEVCLGYTEDEAVNEANRCLSCKNPMCRAGCPVSIDIPNFISKIKERDFDGAYDIISQSSCFPAICGRVCPQETQCEQKCIRGLKGESVAIGRLERFVADYHNSKTQNSEQSVKKNGHKIAIVGSGPSSLSCAGDLANLGYDVTVFEALHKFGGVLVYGIPEFRLPKKIVELEINKLIDKGVKLVSNVVIGKSLTIEDLFDDGFEAIFIGSGAGLPKFMNIEGENLNGVLSANEFLTRANLMKAYTNDSDTPINNSGKIIVVGGGNVAMDAARTALRLGASEVHIVYRRSENELPARKEEVEHAKEEGIVFGLLTNPVKIVGNFDGDKKTNERYGFVQKIICKKMELTEKDERGRCGVKEIDGSDFEIDADCVIMALGTTANPIIKNAFSGLETDERGNIKVDENCKTSIDGIFAGGDAVTGAATVISAMGAGKKAAKGIDEFIKSKEI